MTKIYSLEELKARAQEAEFIKTLPASDPRRQKFYDESISNFIGSGPKGIYEALLKARAEERSLNNAEDMGKIATLIHHCSHCHDYFNLDVSHCPNCNEELNPVAVIDAYALKQLLAKLSTPEGIVNLLEHLKKWIEG